MPNFRDRTASEIIAQMPQARNILAKHFGPEVVTTGSGLRVRDLAQKRDVDLGTVVRDLNDMAKATGAIW
jgi:iron-sulfur cluster repair protein YtfE (RIC family)